MGELVEDMLLLARLDAGRPLAVEPVDLTTLLDDVASNASAVHHDRPLRVDDEEGLQLRGDEDRLRQVFGALVTNAFVHNRPAVSVILSVRRSDKVCVIEVADGGADVAGAGRASVRAVRARDPGRSRNHGGSGLGLAIVRSVVESHGGAVALTTGDGEGTTVRVTLPVDGPASAGALAGAHSREQATTSEEIPSRSRAGS